MPHTAAKPNPRPGKPRTSSGWSAERRARHTAAMRRWRPWEKSTGPRTPTGKAKSSQNACKPEAAALRLLNKALAGQKRYLLDYKRFMAMQKFMDENELLKQCRRAFIQRGEDVTNALINALYAFTLFDPKTG